MKIVWKMLLVGVLLSSVCVLSSCNTTNGLSQDVNHASDSIHNAINS